MERALAMIEPIPWRRLAVVCDAVALQLAAVVGVFLAGHGDVPIRVAGLATIYVVFALGLMSMSHRGLGRLPASGLHPCLDAVKACTIGIVLAIAAASLLGGAHLGSTAFKLWGVTAAATCAVRLALLVAGRNARRRGTLLTPTLLVGAGVVGSSLARDLAERPEYGLQPVGFLDASPLPGVERDHDLPVLGDPDDLERVTAETGAQHVILAFTRERDHHHVALLKRCQALGLGVSVVPRLYESLNEGAQLDHVGGMPLLSLKNDPNGFEVAVKQAFDRIGTAIAQPRRAESLLAAGATLAEVPPVQSEVPSLQAVQSRDYADPGCAPEERDDAAPGSPEARPALRLVDGAEPAASTMWFCGYCGEVPSDPLAPAPVARVCRSCEQGLMLEARADAAPTASEPFLVVDSRLTIQAVSKQAEEILGVREEDATNRPVAELLVGADSEAGADRSLATMLMDAASESDQPETTFVRPRATYGVRLRARIATCGPPRAALIVFERSPTQPSPLRVVREGLPIAEHG